MIPSVDGLSKLAGKSAGDAAAGVVTEATRGTSAVTGFFGGMISPLLKFFNDVIKQRAAAADEAAKKREARDDKIVEICEKIWKEELAIKTLVVEKEEGINAPQAQEKSSEAERAPAEEEKASGEERAPEAQDKPSQAERNTPRQKEPILLLTNAPRSPEGAPIL